MSNEKSSFNQAFTYLYFLMLSADKIADLKELKLGNKIIQLEKLDKEEVMKNLDKLSAMPREKVFESAMLYVKSAPRNIQLKCLGYIKLMAQADGFVDEKERELLNEISLNELNISLSEVADMGKKLKQKVESIRE